MYPTQPPPPRAFLPEVDIDLLSLSRPLQSLLILNPSDILSESPGLDLGFEHFVQLCWRSTDHRQQANSAEMEWNLPRCFRKDKPGAYDERSGESGEEETSLEAPIKRVDRDHVRCSVTERDTNQYRYTCCKPSSSRSEPSV